MWKSGFGENNTMNTNITQTYHEALSREWESGKATEHSYRPALKAYVEGFNDRILALNEAKRVQVGAPDLTLSRKRGRDRFDIGHIEAKKPGEDLDKIEKSDQLKRYRGEFENLILTDHLEFRFYRDGAKVETVKIGALTPGGLVRHPTQFNRLEDLLRSFLDYQGQKITNAKRLARMMARKARLMRSTFREALKEKNRADFPELVTQLNAFRKILIHDLTDEDFADVYAQTIAYGLFTARVHDLTLDTFDRSEARDLIPKSNPFLRNLFDYICGPNIEDGIVWAVDELCEIFLLTNPNAILQDFGRRTGRFDPMVHFYEEFLSEYDPKLRKSRGVWYTPEPVVNFIVRAIDDALKTHFNLQEGLANKDKIEIKTSTGGGKKHQQTEKVHRVQLLDVAAGTGTFTAEAIRQISERFKGQEGVWSQYVEQDLLPRIHGFEILMASYAMCHLKVDLLLKELGYKPTNTKKPPRLSVYLTNSLEEHHPDADGLFAHWLSQEANEASRVKRDLPIMVAYGNPPYSGISSNMSDYQRGLIEPYKYIDGVHFGERKHWLHDDYVKFIRLAEGFIEKSPGGGVLAYITNHGYLDNPTFRGMRWHLLNTFDDIYILDLHGNAKKKEVSPDGSADKNVFDIQTGVAIIIAVKKEKPKKGLATVHHQDAWGSRNSKYNMLFEENIFSKNFTKIQTPAPMYFMVPKDYALAGVYEQGFSIKQSFSVNSVGFVSARDIINISFNEESAKEKIEFLQEADENSVRRRFGIDKDSTTWKVRWAQDDARNTNINENLQKVNYRPFDIRHTVYTGKSGGLYARPIKAIMKHFLAGENFGLHIGRQGQVVGSMQWNLVYVSKDIIDFNTFYRGGVLAHPLYLYNEDGSRQPNLAPDLISEFSKCLNLPFTDDHSNKDANGTTAFSPLDVLDYIYAVLHSPLYRDTYKEFLKTDFPRVPYPDKKTFWQLVALGREVRLFHLMEHKDSDKLITTFPKAGDGFLDKIKYNDSKNRVYINAEQYFGDVPKDAWAFHIGGYQPAQKWLKDRKKADRKLVPDDIMHWQKIIVAQTNTIRLMKEIDRMFKL